MNMSSWAYISSNRLNRSKYVFRYVKKKKKERHTHKIQCLNFQINNQTIFNTKTCDGPERPTALGIFYNC